MYGKLFIRMYQGSMVGAGSHVFAVWGYCIANADPESHVVDLNPALLSAVIGDTPERIREAIAYLSRPDPHSHNTDQEGRRIVPTTGFEYFLVSHELYRDITNHEDLRAYFRENKRKQRMSRTVLDNLGKSQDSACASASEQQDKESDFNAFWVAYPRKDAKKAALKAWQKATDKPALEIILAAVARQKATEQWRKDSGQYIPMPATWLNQGRWDDKPIEAPKPYRGPNI